MERNTRILIGAIIILFIAMVSFKFETLTGAVVNSEWKSSATLKLWPITMNKPGETIQGTIETATQSVSPLGGGTIITGKSYIDTTKRVCVYEKINNARKFCVNSYCTKEDDKKLCIGARFELRTGALDYGKEYAVKFWEYPGVGKASTLGKEVYGGKFTIKPEIKKLPHE